MKALEKRRKRDRRRRDSDRLRTLQKFPVLSQSLSTGTLTFGHPDTVAVVTHQDISSVNNSASIAVQRQTRKLQAINQTYCGMPMHLLQSSFDDFSLLHDFRKQLMTSKSQASITNATSHRTDKQEESEGAAREEREEPLDAALRKLRNVVERLLESKRYDLDLRGFEGEAMNAEEFRKQLKSQLGVHLTTEETLAVVDHLDEDKNGLIDYSEVVQKFYNPEKLSADNKQIGPRSAIDRFMMVMEKIKAAVEKSEEEERRKLMRKSRRKRKSQLEALEAIKKQGGKLALLFREFDQNGDGLISKDEFVDLLLDKLELRLHEREVEQVFDILDPNGDGHLQYTEFVSAYHNRRAYRAKLIKDSMATQKKTPSRLKAPFFPCNPHQARLAINRPAVYWDKR